MIMTKDPFHIDHLLADGFQHVCDVMPHWDVWTYNSLAITYCMLGFRELATLAAQKGIAIAKATKDPEHLLEQFHELLDDAKHRSFDPKRKQIAPETYGKWKELMS